MTLKTLLLADQFISDTFLLFLSGFSLIFWMPPSKLFRMQQNCFEANSSLQTPPCRKKAQSFTKCSFLSLSRIFSLWVSVSLSLSLILSLCVCVCLSFSLSYSFSMCVCVSVSLSLTNCLSFLSGRLDWLESCCWHSVLSDCSKKMFLF